MLALSGLFLAALMAATLIPAQSEIVLVGLIMAGDWPVWILVTVATCGNVLGSTINWFLGRFLMQFSDRAWFPFSKSQWDRAAKFYDRYGYHSLWASWVPVIGDPLTFAAGVLQTPLWRFLLIVTAAKAGRYAVLAWATMDWFRFGAS